MRVEKKRSNKLPIPMRRDDRFRCTRCGSDASFGFTSVQNPKIKQDVRLCMNCYQRQFKKADATA